jgi:hypothetical protein
LLVEIRIATQRDSFLALLPRTSVLQPELIQLYLNQSSRSPSHIDLFSFKVTVLVPLQWGHQHFQVWGFLSIHIPPIYALPLACDPSPILLPMP